MKIRKEFVDLIYSGEKKYEFRICNCNPKNEHEGIYKVKDKFFSLEYDYFYDNLWELIDMYKEKIDKQSLLFIVDNWYEFSNGSQFEYGSVFVVYEWKELKTRELEIIE